MLERLRAHINKNKRVLFIDIDGVLADCTHRLKYINGKKKDYDKFYGAVSKDKPMQDPLFIKDLAESYCGKIVFLTGRRESCLSDTIKWLNDNYEIPYDVAILFRENGDHRPAPELKAGLALKYASGHKIKACMVIDDMVDNIQAVTDALSDYGIKRVVGCRISLHGEIEEESE